MRYDDERQRLAGQAAGRVTSTMHGRVSPILEVAGLSGTARFPFAENLGGDFGVGEANGGNGAAAAIRFTHAKVTAKILSKGKAAVPDKNPTRSATLSSWSR